MKARFLALVALVLGLASCQKDTAGFDVTVDGEVSTTVTVNLADASGTRAGETNSAYSAIANGVVADDDYTLRYILQVFDEDGATSKDMVVKYSDESEVSFDVRLVPNRHYNFVAWADIVRKGNEVAEECAYDAGRDLHYTVVDHTLQKVTLNGDWKAMDETRDAYTGVYSTKTEDQKYTATSSINLTLTRPFAKLRVVTTDMAELFGGVEPAKATVEYTTAHYNAFNALEGKVIGDSKNRDIKHEDYIIKSYGDNVENQSMVLFTDYFFAKTEQEAIQFTLSVVDGNNNPMRTTYFNTDIPVKRNYLTTITGNVLTDGNKVNVDINDSFTEPGIKVEYVEVSTAADLQEAIENATTNGEETTIVLAGDINLNDLFAAGTMSTRANNDDPSLTIPAGTNITFDLNSKTLSATSSQTGKNYNMFNVRGTLTVTNGTIEYKHEGENMGWNSSTNLFDVTAGGVLNLKNVTAKNLGGSDMGFVAHLNNWGEVTLNVEDSTLESNYVAVRVFNSGPNMNNVTIKNSTLNGVSAAFWVHNYTVEDFGTEAKVEAQKALLNFDIFDESNTFSPIVGIRYGFTNPLRFDSYGITRSVNNGVVTLGKLFGEGVVRRGVAGTEKNNDITKVVVGEGITELTDRTFYRYFALETVELPSTLTVLGANGDDYYTNGNVFQGCAALKNIVIPESVTTMGPGVFYGCSSLESINIPAGVTRIEKDALRETGLKKVEFPASVNYFGAMAFRDCKQLTEVVINAPEFTMEGNTFGIMAAPYTPMTIYVANAEMKAYVESKLGSNEKKYITVKAPAVVTDKASLQAALETAVKNGEKNIFIDASNFSGDMQYCFSESNVPAGVTVTIRNAEVTGSGHWNYANGTLIFENCAFKAGVYSIHFDAGEGNLIFKNCKLVGWCSFGALNAISFENCTLTGNGSYALIRSYADLSLKNCVIDTTNANHNDEYSDGVEAIGKTLTEENVTYIDNHTAYLQNVLKAGKHVVLSSNLTINEGEMMTAPYGNKMALHHNGGLFDGNNNTLSVTIGGDNYAVMTSGGTIKDLTVDNGFRGILVMSPTQTVYLNNVVSSGEGVCYALNTAEGDSTQDIVATNCTFDGWCSWSEIKSATFTNCTFGQGTYYTNVYGRLGKPYVNTLFDGCNFCSKYYIDLSALKADQKVTLKNCTVNGVKITAENWTSLVAPEDTCGEGQISVELKNGKYLTAENVVDYIVFE